MTDDAPRVFITRALPEAGVALLRRELQSVQLDVYEGDSAIPRATLLARVRGCSAILPLLTDAIDAETLDAAGPSLRIVANYAVGYNNIDVDAATERGVAVTNTPDVLTDATADLAWALLMAAARRIPESERFLRAGCWTGWAPKQFLGSDLVGRTAGVFGMGRIGQAFSRRATGFGMRVIYTQRNPAPSEVERELGAERVDKATLLAESDFLSLHCPLTDETRHAFGAAEFRSMKRSAILVNTARGPVIDEAALAEALRSGAIRAAGLDVYEEEPKVHPALLTCENAVLVPHLGSATHATRDRMAEMAAESIVARLRGEVPRNCVNPEACRK